MKLAVFDDYRLGVLDGDDHLVDVTDALPWPHDPDPVTAGWWRALMRDLDEIRPRIERAAAEGERMRLTAVALRPPVVNPSKIVAAASNYAAHVEEMHQVQARTLGGVEDWMMQFDVFLKSPSSIVGPGEAIVLPAEELAAGREIHHESELVIVIGQGGRDIPVERALEHVAGYTIGLDITVRSAADRSRRKSYDTFSPIGPWVVTADAADAHDRFSIELTVDGDVRQSVHTSDLITDVPHTVAYASRMMSLLPGDLLFTGAPPGVGPIRAGERLVTRISSIGELVLTVRDGVPCP